jgi:hypothetical protein
MNRLFKWAYVLPIINVLCMVLVQPFVVGYFAMDALWQAIYILVIFGSPIWVVFPIGLLMAVLALFPYWGKQTYFAKWKHLTKQAFIGASLILLAFNTLILFSKFVLHHEAFPKVRYDSITDYATDCSDLKTGKFTYRNKHILRGDSVQTEYNTDYTDSTVYAVEWLQDFEYRLINLSGKSGMNDTLDVRITHNTPQYYEGFMRMGEYAQYYRVLKY